MTREAVATKQDSSSVLGPNDGPSGRWGVSDQVQYVRYVLSPVRRVDCQPNLPLSESTPIPFVRISIPLRRQDLGAGAVSASIALSFPERTALAHVLVSVADVRERLGAVG
jgi:hypothetical protein